MRRAAYLYWFVIMLAVVGCKKKVLDCDGQENLLQPFNQKVFVFSCNNNLPYQYSFTSMADVNSLQSQCHFGAQIASPLEEQHVRYLLLADTMPYYRDTIMADVYKNDCAKTVTYDVRFVQQSHTLNTYPDGIGSIFTIMEDVPEDYVVIFKKQYVALP